MDIQCLCRIYFDILCMCVLTLMSLNTVFLFEYNPCSVKLTDSLLRHSAVVYFFSTVGKLIKQCLEGRRDWETLAGEPAVRALGEDCGFSAYPVDPSFLIYLGRRKYSQAEPYHHRADRRKAGLGGIGTERSWNTPDLKPKSWFIDRDSVPFSSIYRPARKVRLCVSAWCVFCFLHAHGQ